MVPVPSYKVPLVLTAIKPFVPYCSVANSAAVNPVLITIPLLCPIFPRVSLT